MGRLKYSPDGSAVQAIDHDQISLSGHVYDPVGIRLYNANGDGIEYVRVVDPDAADATPIRQVIGGDVKAWAKPLSLYACSNLAWSEFDNEYDVLLPADLVYALNISHSPSHKFTRGPHRVTLVERTPADPSAVGGCSYWINEPPSPFDSWFRIGLFTDLDWLDGEWRRYWYLSVRPISYYGFVYGYSYWERALLDRWDAPPGTMLSTDRFSGVGGYLYWSSAEVSTVQEE